MKIGISEHNKNQQPFTARNEKINDKENVKFVFMLFKMTKQMEKGIICLQR